MRTFTLLAFSTLSFVGITACGGEDSTPVKASKDSPNARRNAALKATCSMTAEVAGVVEEVLQVSRYTYLRLRSGEDTAWAAVRRSDVDVGDAVRIVHAIEMRDFRSPSTGKVFPTLYMGYLASATEQSGSCTRSIRQQA